MSTTAYWFLHDWPAGFPQPRGTIAFAPTLSTQDVLRMASQEVQRRRGEITPFADGFRPVLVQNIPGGTDRFFMWSLTGQVVPVDRKVAIREVTRPPLTLGVPKAAVWVTLETLQDQVSASSWQVNPEWQYAESDPADPEVPVTLIDSEYSWVVEEVASKGMLLRRRIVYSGWEQVLLADKVEE